MHRGVVEKLHVPSEIAGCILFHLQQLTSSSLTTHSQSDGGSTWLPWVYRAYHDVIPLFWFWWYALIPYVCPIAVVANRDGLWGFISRKKCKTWRGKCISVVWTSSVRRLWRIHCRLNRAANGLDNRSLHICHRTYFTNTNVEQLVKARKDIHRTVNEWNRLSEDRIIVACL